MKVHSVKFNFIMNFILTVSSIIFPMITFPYISRILLPEGNGKIAFVNSVTTYFTMFASLGIPTYGIRVCAGVRDDKEKLSKTVQELLIINAVTMSITCVLFLTSVLLIPEFYEEKTLFIIYMIGMIISMFSMNWLYSALEQYSYITVCNLIVKMIFLGLVFSLIKKKEDYILYGGITILANVSTYFVNLIYSRRFITFKKSEKYEFRKHLKPIFIFFAMSAAINVYTNLDVIMLRFMKGNMEVGYYNTAIKIKTILVTLITSLGTVLLPRLSYYIKKDRREIFNQTIVKAFHFVILLGLSLMVYFMMFAEEAILLIAGDAYRASISPMTILMPTLLFIGLSNITGIQVLTPKNDEKKVLYSILFGAGVDFLLNLFLIPGYSSSGAAFATLIAELVVLSVQCVYLKDMLSVVLKEISFWKIIFSLLLASFVGLSIKIYFDAHVFMRMLISACVFFGVFGIVLLVLREKFLWEILRSVLNTKG